MSNQKPNDTKKVSGSKISREEKLKQLGFDLTADVGFTENRSRLDVPKDLIAELKSFNLAYRFINYRIYKETGFNKSDWKPYAFETRGKYPNMDSNGYLVSQDLILAAKPEEMRAAQRAHLDKKNRARGRVQQVAKEQMQQSLAQSGNSAGIRVTEGFDD